MQWHVGGGVFVSFSPGYPTVNIRHVWRPDDSPEPIPTKKEVTLLRNKLARLRDALEEIHESVPELKDTELCMLSESHQNQLGMLNCPECTPFGYDAQDNMSMECNVGDLQDLVGLLFLWWTSHAVSRGGVICWLACSFGGHHTPYRGGFIC